jgi:uncharacterized membrane protein
MDTAGSEIGVVADNRPELAVEESQPARPGTYGRLT